MRKYESHASPSQPAPTSLPAQPFPLAIHKPKASHNEGYGDDSSPFEPVSFESSNPLPAGGVHSVPCPRNQTRHGKATAKNFQDETLTKANQTSHYRSQKIPYPDPAYLSEKQSHTYRPRQLSTSWHEGLNPDQLAFSNYHGSCMGDDVYENHVLWLLVRLSTHLLGKAMANRLTTQALSFTSIPFSKSVDWFLHLLHHCFSSSFGSMPLLHCA